MKRRAPWVEGLLLALLVAVVFALGGEAVRASYHGYLKAAHGEAVLRDGLCPENPHHAGSPLRYYTLYSTLAVALGRLGFGPLWGFALLNVASALLFGPALDALGRALGLSFAARRGAFVAAVLGFNGLGWLGFLVSAGEPFGSPPVYALFPLTLAGEPFGWDARLQCFLPKYFNVSSHTLTLPFALWALAACLPARDRAGPSAARPWAAVVPAALSLAMNPLLGGVVGLVMIAWLAPVLARGPRRERLAWIGAGAAAFALALPTLLPAFHPPPSGPELTGDPALGGSPLANLLGPLALLAVPGILGLRSLAPDVRWRWVAAVALLSAGVLFVEVPERSEYKIARLGGLLWALPAGAWAGGAWSRGGARRALAVALALACVPTTALAVRAYVAWGRNAPPLPLRAEAGRLALDASAVAHAPPPEIFAAEASFDPRAVVVMHPFQPGAASQDGLVQGNALAAVLRHPLFVDLPQIDNDGIEDLAERIDEAHALWEGRGWSAPRRGLSLAPADALASIRARLRDRPFLVLTHDSAAHVGEAASAAGGRAIARAGGYTLWALEPLGG